MPDQHLHSVSVAGVVVDDRAGRRAVGDRGALRLGQGEEHGLVRLVEVVPVDRHTHGAGRDAGRERQRGGRP